MEELEKVESGDLANTGTVEKYSPPVAITIEQSFAGQMAIDVYGQQIEPICNYRTCNHFQHMTIVGHANTATHSIMLQGCHYGQNRYIRYLTKTSKQCFFS
jgi:hypothetical protein